MTPKIRHTATIAVWIVFWMTTCILPAYAHKVTVFAWVEGDRIYTESKFGGGKRVKAGRIEVLDPQGKVLVTGVTDDQGAFSFPIPQHTDLKVVLTAGSGHGNHWVITAAEMNPEPAPEAIPEVTKDQASPPSAAPLSEAPPPRVGDQSPGPQSCPDAREIEAMVARILDAKLAPIKAQLADPGWGPRDILGGIGYILGLMGLAAYLHYRRQSR